MLKNTSQQWGLVSQALHWAMAFLMLLVVALGLIGQELPVSGEKIKIFVYHKSVGIIILALVLLRIFWKLTQTQPDAAAGITPQQHKMAGMGHGVLYGLMLALPISGWLLNSAAGYPFRWMDLFAFPSIPGVGESLKNAFVKIHLYLFYGLVAVAAGHIGMALLHHFKFKDAVLSRMLPKGYRLFWVILSLALVVLTLFIALKTFAARAGEQAAAPAAPVSAIETVAQVVEAKAVTDRQWQILSDESTLGFTNNYDGVEFEGEFKQFSAELFFDDDELEKSVFDVTIDTASVTTFNSDWDASLPDEEWFYFSQFPEARYYATSFATEGESYIADGALTLKGFTQTVPLQFTWSELDDGKASLIGTASLTRTDFGIGSGMWQDDPTIGFNVDIKVNLVLEEK